MYLHLLLLLFTAEAYKGPTRGKADFFPFRTPSALRTATVPTVASVIGAPLISRAAAPIPVEISSTDAASSSSSLASGNAFGHLDMNAATLPALPEVNTDIMELDGGDNLGGFLWAYVLYTGVITTILTGGPGSRPADWVLPFVVKVIGQENQEWFIDYLEGYRFTVPPLAEAARTVLFVTLGFYTNALIVSSFDGDTFWGWSTAGALAIPAGKQITSHHYVAPSHKETNLNQTKILNERLTRTNPLPHRSYRTGGCGASQASDATRDGSSHTARERLP